MAPKKQQRSRRKNNKMVVSAPRRVPRPVVESNESKLLSLMMDPCGGPLAHGYALSSEGLVNRFTRFITPVATTETAFAYIWNPNNQTTNAITQKLAVGTGVPTFVNTGPPGEAFLETNADAVSTLAACIQVLYTGKLVDRKGYIGVCQVNGNTALDLASSSTDLPTLLTYCQQVCPVPSNTVELKWAPTIRNFTAQNYHSENYYDINDNCLIVVAIGVNPNDFVVKFTTVNEYTPKFTLGQPAPRATRSIPVGLPERLTTKLDRMGTWWHNLGDTAGAAFRLGAAAYYGAGQVARTATAYARVAAPLLALAG